MFVFRERGEEREEGEEDGGRERSERRRGGRAKPAAVRVPCFVFEFTMIEIDVTINERQEFRK